jgi:hypothetical protein
MIQCIGTIQTDNGTYIDPMINVYFLSYSEKFGVMAIPQIVDMDGGPIDQLDAMKIDPPSATTTNRIEITNLTIMFLSNLYPNNQFLVIP